MARPWLRLYRKIVESKKVHDLRPELFKPWVMILACTDDEGNLPSNQQLAFKLRQPETRIEAWLMALVNLRFIDKTETGYAAHDWTDWNFDSDVSTERVKRFRERNCNGLDTDTEEDTETDSEKRPTRWPTDAVVSEAWIEDGHAYRAKHKLSPANLKLEGEKFASHFTQKRKKYTDWHRTWLNWCVSEYVKGISNGSGFNGQPPKQTAHTRIAAKAAAARAEQERRADVFES